MPVLDKSQDDDGYEGAIVLPPKCNIYTEEDPVAINDYSSLYPSSMISEIYHMIVKFGQKNII